MHNYTETYQYQYIDSNKELSRVCETLQTRSVLSIDTEFVRTRTLRPKLGLIQIFDTQQVYLVDPIAIKDLSELATLFSDTSIVKVAHSCSEDLEAIWHRMGAMPAPVFDTQVAAAFDNMGMSLGYANLVDSLFDIQLDKTESLTDWTHRPLTQAQCEYASADVTHLMALYEHFIAKFDGDNKLDWIFDEVASLAHKKSLPMRPDCAYLGAKNNWKLRGINLEAFKLLSAWRVITAIKEDKALNFVVKESALFQLATKLPTTNHSLFECNELFSRQARQYGSQIIAICDKARTTDSSELTKRINRLIDFAGYKACLSLCKKTIEDVALRHDIPASLLASKKQMNQLLSWCWFDTNETECVGLQPDLLTGWRAKLLATELQKGSELVNKIENSHEVKRSL